MGALRLLRYAFTALLLAGLSQLALAERKPFDIGSPPAWVAPLAADLSAEAPSEVAKGVHYLLVDAQVRIDGAERVVYRHMAAKALNGQGVESIANVEIRFDPSYQRLTLHAINVRRGARLIPKLNAAAVRMLQRETELEALIFDGSMTASVFLDDVRVGDVVEYEYSVRGHNPVFARKQFGQFDLQWAVPVARAHSRLLWPLGRELNLLQRNNAPAAATSDGATHRDYRWDLHGVAGKQVESDAPAWFDPYPSVQWGEFKDWQAVARWAVPLYRLPERPAPSVQAEVARISAQHADAGDRLLAALRFVQREVRYLGIEIGGSSHAPSPPEVVLERRFGDCKDKALLTVALLRGLGIEAQPALVNTSLRRGISQWQATPSAFNHVVVHARLNGEHVWIDPTRAPQQGGLTQLVQADYGPSLVVDERSDALMPMAGERALTHWRQVRAVLDSRAGFDRPVRYTVTTVVEGAAADSLRSTLASRSHDDLQKQYVNFYAAYYAGVEVAAPLDVSDDASANQLTLTEHYSIKDFWQRSAQGKRLEASIEVPEMLDHLRKPRNQVRNSPLSLNYPVDLMHVTEVMLPGRWNLKPDKVRVDDPAFEFQRDERWKGQTLILSDHFKSRRDHIAAPDVARYTANLETARQGANYTLYYTDAPAAPPAAGAPHWLPAVAGTLALLGFVMLAMRVYRWDPQPWSAGEYRFPMPPSGLGGWLVLVAIGLGFSVLRVGRTLWDSLASYTTEPWLALTSVGSADHHPLWAPALLFGLVANIGLLIGYGLTAVLFFKRRSSLPGVYIVMMTTGFAFAGLDIALTNAIPAAAQSLTHKDWGGLVRGGVSWLIWTAYFLRSGRVRMTFVERYRKQPQATTLEAAPAA